MSAEAARPPREKRRSGWFEDFEVSKVAKKQPSPTLRGRPGGGGLPPRLPGGPTAAPSHTGREAEQHTDDSEEVLLIATQEEEQGRAKPVATITNGQQYPGPVDQALFDEATLEAQLDRTPGLAGLVELATTPVGTPNCLVGDAGKVGHGPPALDLAATADPKDSISEGEKRVTIWNPFEKRKLSGNSAPFKKNLEDYLKKHPDWEEYWGQDLDEHGRKLFPRKRRRTSAEPSPALTAKSGPAAGAGGISMMDGLLQLASEEQGLGGSAAAKGHSLGSLGSRVTADNKMAHASSFGSGRMLSGSVLSPASSTKAALSMVGAVVADAIEDSCRDKLQRPALPQLTPTPTALSTMGSGPMPSLKSC